MITAIRVRACKPPRMRHTVEADHRHALIEGRCGLYVVRSGKSLSGNEIIPDLTLPQRAVALGASGPHRSSIVVARPMTVGNGTRSCAGSVSGRGAASTITGLSTLPIAAVKRGKAGFGSASQAASG